MSTLTLLKALDNQQYIPINGLSERVYYPLIVRGEVVIINVGDLGLCLCKLTGKNHPIK